MDWEAGLVEDLAGLDAQVRQVAGIEADAHQRMASLAEPAADLDRLAHALQRVVRIDQEHAVVGHGLGVGPEGLQLVVEAHDPTVGVGPAHGNPVELAGQHVGGGRAAADVGRPAGRHSAVDALGAAKPELQHRLAPGRHDHAGRLGRHERLEIRSG